MNIYQWTAIGLSGLGFIAFCAIVYTFHRMQKDSDKEYMEHLKK